MPARALLPSYQSLQREKERKLLRAYCITGIRSISLFFSKKEKVSMDQTAQGIDAILDRDIHLLVLLLYRRTIYFSFFFQAPSPFVSPVSLLSVAPMMERPPPRWLKRRTSSSSSIERAQRKKYLDVLFLLFFRLSLYILQGTIYYLRWAPE